MDRRFIESLDGMEPEEIWRTLSSGEWSPGNAKVAREYLERRRVSDQDRRIERLLRLVGLLTGTALFAAAMSALSAAGTVVQAMMDVLSSGR